ncbi:MAG: hypothetical protein KDD69_06855 [Bdellovibrionales bacterium]|nr:hypothetical protein [Bdellovibrionales bacterium]
MKRFSEVLQWALLWPLLAMVCWGVYGPTLGQAKVAFGGSIALALAMIGIAYGIHGVGTGLALLTFGVVPDKGNWNTEGWKKGLAAGALGIGGNLCLISALHFYHNVVVVMPLVFGGVQMFNTVFTCLALRTMPKRGFFAGVLLLTVGVVLALAVRPASPHQEGAINWLFLPCVIGVWLCWGRYGGQVQTTIGSFGKSGIRAMVALSVACLVLGAGGGFAAFQLGLEPSAILAEDGVTKGLIAGLITTSGAWGISFGNRYVKGGHAVVMPLVFAGAPVVNTMYAMKLAKIGIAAIHPLFWLAIALIIAGGYLVLTQKPETAH